MTSPRWSISCPPRTRKEGTPGKRISGTRGQDGYDAPYRQAHCGTITFAPICLAGTRRGQDERCLQTSTSRTILRSSFGCRSARRRRRTLLRQAALLRLASFLTQSFTRRKKALIGLRSRGSRPQMSCLGRTRSGFYTQQSQPKRPLRGQTGPNANESPSRGWLWGGAWHRRQCFVAVTYATLCATNPRW